jgi:glycosyltransferase involved in cell wall biosynthesis
LSDKPAISISVFFPCHNEQDNIERVVQQALDVLPTISDDYEIIIVNDGSADRTAEIADRLAEANPSIRVVHHHVNRGYGGALQSGFRNASKEWVFYTDGDGQFDIRELPGLLEYIDNYDIVTCYRINRQDAWLRKFNGWAWSKLVNLLFHFKIKDVDCAFKLYRREIFDHIEMHSEGALIDAEILARAHRAGYRITQCGVHHYPRTAGRQSGANFKVILRAFKELFKLRKQIKNH